MAKNMKLKALSVMSVVVSVVSFLVGTFIAQRGTVAQTSDVSATEYGAPMMTEHGAPFLDAQMKYGNLVHEVQDYVSVSVEQLGIDMSKSLEQLKKIEERLIRIEDKIDRCPLTR